MHIFDSINVVVFFYKFDQTSELNKYNLGQILCDMYKKTHMYLLGQGVCWCSIQILPPTEAASPEARQEPAGSNLVEKLKPFVK